MSYKGKCWVTSAVFVIDSSSVVTCCKILKAGVCSVRERNSALTSEGVHSKRKGFALLGAGRGWIRFQS